MRYVVDKIIFKQVLSLNERGGKYQKAALVVNSVLGKLNYDKNPFHGLSLTNNGESRIAKCHKYDLTGFCRLITITDNGVTGLVYVGNHDECDKWLEKNKGYTLTLNEKNEILNLKVANDLSENEIRRVESKIADETLLSLLKDRYRLILEDNIRASVFKRMERLTSFSSEDEIFEICSDVRDNSFGALALDVLFALKANDIDEAKNRILYFEEKLIKLSDATEEQISEAKSSDSLIFLDDFEENDIKRLISTTNWYDWMLFLHPQQRVVVQSDFNGSARLLGVSGSGKTCVAVKRAIRLAKKYPGEKILITTINESLSDLIKKLIQIALTIEKNPEQIAEQIEVKSFWNVCKDIIEEFETDRIILRSLDDYSDKNLEDIDEVWGEFFFCENNNDDADIFDPIVKSLSSRSIFSSEYIRQELDWIRSALPPTDFKNYLGIDREGRSIPYPETFRKIMLDGLESWHKKMDDVGVCDYLGLLRHVYKYEGIISPKYRCILVDELQDFGTTELAILRKLTSLAENDLFLCGDIAQQVQIKSHKITGANIRINPNNYLQINKNYRNSREILEAASAMFIANTKEEQYNSDSFTLLKPEFANFSSPKPFIRKSNSFSLELSNAINYLIENLEDHQKGCIAICGMSFYQVQNIGLKLDIEVLNGKTDTNNSKLFLSDLNQTKGFEFDRVIIINCSRHIFPDPLLPEDEHYKEISKLYVAMTRAKTELIISYSDVLSTVFSDISEYFNMNTKWNDYLDEITNPVLDEIPEDFIEFGKVNTEETKIGNYLKQRKALGLSQVAQEKLTSLITGQVLSVSYNGVSKQKTWKDIPSFTQYLSRGINTAQMSSILGKKTHDEIVEHFKIRKV
jgi:superfamily I DNA and RNA helicase